MTRCWRTWIGVAHEGLTPHPPGRRDRRCPRRRRHLASRHDEAVDDVRPSNRLAIRLATVLPVPVTRRGVDSWGSLADGRTICRDHRPAHAECQCEPESLNRISALATAASRARLAAAVKAEPTLRSGQRTEVAVYDELGLPVGLLRGWLRRVGGPCFDVPSFPVVPCRGSAIALVPWVFFRILWNSEWGE